MDKGQKLGFFFDLGGERGGGRIWMVLVYLGELKFSMECPLDQIGIYIDLYLGALV